MTHLPDPLDTDPRIPEPARRLTEYLGSIIEKASLFQPEQWRGTNMRCRRRPGRQRCPGQIHVRIGKEDPPEIHWACPRCEENGIIRNWQGSACDLSDVGWDLPEDVHGQENVSAVSKGDPSVIPIYQVDAFTDRLFEGNPAAVCPLTDWLSDDLLQKIAAENNLSETAFFVSRDDEFELRWFTPEVEVDLCGHATLAAAFVLMDLLEPSRRSVTFRSRSGPLYVTREGDLFSLDFPGRPPAPITEPPGLSGALGAPPASVLKSRDTIAVFDDPDTVRRLAPDMEKLKSIGGFAVCATAPGTGRDGDVDYVLRFFAPAQGISEDPVTGSAQCSLAPYWSERLGKTILRARQVSRRGGELLCEVAGDRVRIAGKAVLVFSGILRLPSISRQEFPGNPPAESLVLPREGPGSSDTT
jgi:PhzF family phenazine biosynthesis protein